MSFLNVFNFGRNQAPPPAGGRTEIVHLQNALRRVLSFTGHTIDDVVNDPIAKAKVIGSSTLRAQSCAVLGYLALSHRPRDARNSGDGYAPMK